MVNVNILIAELNAELKNKYHDYKGIYFHGSRLNGKPAEDSDYDFVFVFEKDIDWKFKNEVLNIIYDFELKYDILIDARIYNAKEIIKPTSLFKETIKQHGKFYGI